MSAHWTLDQFVDTEAGRVAFGSQGDGPPLVLAHGWPWSSYAWHRVIPALAHDFRVFWYDMPGYGQSEKNPHIRTALDVQGRIFVEMLQHWGLECPNVLAHDIGGAYTLRAHLLHGCEFDRYLMMNVVALRPWGSTFFDHVGHHTEAFEGLPPHIHEAVVRAYILGAMLVKPDPRDLENLVAPWLTEDGQTSFYRQFAQAEEALTAEMEPYFGDIRCPAMILWGNKDPWIPIERGRALRNIMNGVGLIEITGAGHLPQLEVPVAVVAHTRSFLNN